MNCGSIIPMPLRRKVNEIPNNVWNFSERATCSSGPEAIFYGIKPRAVVVLRISVPDSGFARYWLDRGFWKTHFSRADLTIWVRVGNDFLKDGVVINTGIIVRSTVDITITTTTFSVGWTKSTKRRNSRWTKCTTRQGYVWIYVADAAVAAFVCFYIIIWNIISFPHSSASRSQGRAEWHGDLASASLSFLFFFFTAPAAAVIFFHFNTLSACASVLFVCQSTERERKIIRRCDRAKKKNVPTGFFFF